MTEGQKALADIRARLALTPLQRARADQAKHAAWVKRIRETDPAVLSAAIEDGLFRSTEELEAEAMANQEAAKTWRYGDPDIPGVYISLEQMRRTMPPSAAGSAVLTSWSA